LFLGLGVGEDDPSFFVRDNDRVRRPFKEIFGTGALRGVGRAWGLRRAVMTATH